MFDFAFAGIGVTARDFQQPGVVIQFGRIPNRIDLLTSIDGVTFEEAWKSRVVVNVDGLAVNFISKEHLLRNKLASGRPQDTADAEKLK